MKSAFAEPEFVIRNGKPVSVIIPIQEYEAMLERLGDAKDLAHRIKAWRKPSHYRPLKEVLANLAKK